MEKLELAKAISILKCLMNGGRVHTEDGNCEWVLSEDLELLKVGKSSTTGKEVYMRSGYSFWPLKYLVKHVTDGDFMEVAHYNVMRDLQKD